VPHLKKEWGCETPSQSVVWEIDGNDLYICPVKAIPDTVIDFWTEYEYYRRFPNAMPTYHKQTAKWLEAMSLYDYHYNDISIDYHNRKNKTKQGIR